MKVLSKSLFLGTKFILLEIDTKVTE